MFMEKEESVIKQQLEKIQQLSTKTTSKGSVSLYLTTILTVMRTGKPHDVVK